MAFIEGLPKSQNKEQILVVIDRFTKYAHFIAMKHLISLKMMAKSFVDNVYKLHGLPTIMVKDRDIIFTSQLSQGLFRSLV